MHVDEFFVGWLPTPSLYARFLRPVVVLVLLLGLTAGILFALQQRSPGTGLWEDEAPRTFEGIVSAEPYALLRTPERTILLVEEGKFGAVERVRPFDGQAVRVKGTLLHREGRWMVELSDLERLGPSRLPLRVLPLGRTTLRGEIIDPKCYLGAMKPGNGKTHKACACLCIRGGIPPMLLSRDANGNERFHLLMTSDRQPMNDDVLPYVGEPVEVTGEEECDGDLNMLRVETIRRF